MKNQIKFIIAIFALLTFSGMVMAQNTEELEKQIEEKIERPSAQRLATMQVMSGPLVPGIKCPLGMQQVITAGIFDNLALPLEATYKSPALTALYPSPPYYFKDFDDKTVNKMVAQSFQLSKYKACESRLCGALLEVQVCNSGTDLWTNDYLHVGTIVGNKFVASVYSAQIWKTTEAKKCKNISIPINLATIASWSTLEVLIQDDTTVDNMKLTLNY